MQPKEAAELLKALPGWGLANGSIEKDYGFNSYLEGLEFANSIGKIAEDANHHPDILIRWRRVKLSLSTHSVKGLSENDFIVAARAELEYQKNL